VCTNIFVRERTKKITKDSHVNILDKKNIKAKFVLRLTLFETMALSNVCRYFLLLTIVLLGCNKCYSTPLDDYVRDNDPHFNWTIIKTYDEPDYKLYVLNFTSQKWMDGKSNLNLFECRKKNERLYFQKHFHHDRFGGITYVSAFHTN